MKTMKKLSQLTAVTAHMLEISHWVAAAAAALLLGLSVFSWDTIASLLPQVGGELEVYGFALEIPAQGPDAGAIRLFALAALLLLPLMAMVFRNIRLILRTADGKTWFAKGSTPFQQDIQRMVREIGIFYLSVPALGLLLSVVGRLALGVDALELSVNLSGFITGITILCLSQVFAYGMELQADVDGLV